MSYIVSKYVRCLLRANLKFSELGWVLEFQVLIQVYKLNFYCFLMFFKKYLSYFQVLQVLLKYFKYLNQRFVNRHIFDLLELA